MDQLNQCTSSSLKEDSPSRKRGRPRKEDSQTQQPVNPPDENLIGQVVSGFVEGTFEAGYLLNVKVAKSEKQLRGLVFLPDKVIPVTQATDLFPQAKMYARENISVPSINQQASLKGKEIVGNQTDHLGSEPQTGAFIDINKTAWLPENFPMSDADDGSVAITERNDPIDTPMKDVDGSSAEKKLTEPVVLPENFPMSDAGAGSVAISERNDPIDTPMKDLDGSSTKEKLTEPVGQNLSLMPQFASDDAAKEDQTVLRYEACAASNKAVTVTTTSPEDSIAKGSTTLVDFIPAPEPSQEQATDSSTLNLKLFQNETTPELSQKQAIDSSTLNLELFQNETTPELLQKQAIDSSKLNLELFQNETTQSRTKDEKSPADAKPHGVEKKPASTVEDVPEEIRLELGNKKMSALSIATEAKPDQSASSKSGFLTNVFKGIKETAKEGEEPNAASESGFLEETTQVDDNDS